MKLGELCKKYKKGNLRRLCYYRKNRDIIQRYWKRDCIVGYRKCGSSLWIILKGVKYLFFFLITTTHIKRYHNEMEVLKQPLNEYKSIIKENMEELKKMAVIQRLK